MVNMRFTMAKIAALGLGAILALGVTLLALLYTGLKSVEAPLDNLTRLSKSNTAITPQPMKEDRKSTRLNSSHLVISYAVFCLKKKKKQPRIPHQRTRPQC